MIRRKLIIAAATIAVALISACADATGPKGPSAPVSASHDCQVGSGSGTVTGC
jgi:hypothetical protein